LHDISLSCQGIQYVTCVFSLYLQQHELIAGCRPLEDLDAAI